MKEFPYIHVRYKSKLVPLHNVRVLSGLCGPDIIFLLARNVLGSILYTKQNPYTKTHRSKVGGEKEDIFGVVLMKDSLTLLPMLLM